MRAFAPVLGARGGGKADLAQGAGGDAGKLADAFAAAARRTSWSVPATRDAGVWIGVDVGTVRVGVARSDPRGVLAVPVATLRARTRTATRDIAELAALVRSTRRSASWSAAA